MPTRLLLLLLGAALAAGCGDASWGPPAAPGPAAHAPPVVKTVHPEYKTRATAIETSGKAQFNEEQLARVQAPLTGRVVEVLARPGDLVESGQRLFVLDSPDLGQAKSDYAKAAADVEPAQKAPDLARALFEATATAHKDTPAPANPRPT